jgi:hypothetical protein
MDLLSATVVSLLLFQSSEARESKQATAASVQDRETVSAPAAMSAAAKALLAALPEEQRAKATRPFDDPQRTTWSFTRGDRLGLYLSEMSEANRALAMKLAESGLSADGIEKVRLTRENENNNRADEVARKVEPTYGGDRYAIIVFGTPGDGLWGWRFEGHHIGLHFSSLGGETTTTPLFFGAFPAALASGPSKGTRPLGAVQDAAIELRRSLSAAQAAQAKVADGPPADIITGPGRESALRDAETTAGLAMADLNEKQRELLWGLVVRHTADLRGDLASDELRRIKALGVERLRFSWAGEPDVSKPHYYRIAGPGFVIEFDCTSGNPDHVHCVWNDPARNFGDALRAHVTDAHPSARRTPDGTPASPASKSTN